MTLRSTEPRYAIYYAPEKGSKLAQFGGRWLRRDAETGLGMVPLPVPGYTVGELAEVVAVPSHYGFHATLKPPFRLSRDVTADMLHDFARSFAAAQEPFVLKGLEVREVGLFLALVPDSQKEVGRLAEACVRAFEPYRGEPTLAEIERYRQRGLTPRQTQYLSQWGYPFVLEEAVFHLTLTDGLHRKKQRKALRLLLMELTQDLRAESHPVREICIFRQPDRDTPFRIVGRYPLGG